MHYEKILRQAWANTKRYKVLWIFGFFIMLSSSGNLSGQFGNIPDIFNSNGEFDAEVSRLWLDHWSLIIGAIILILGLVLLSIIFHYISVGSMVVGVQAGHQQQQVSFMGLLSQGGRFSWKIFGRDIMLGLINFALVMSAFISLLFLAFSIIGLIIVPFSFIALIAIFLAWGFILIALQMFSNHYIVLEHKSIMQALRLAWKDVHLNWKENALLIGIQLLIKLALFLAMLAVCLIIGGVFAIFAFLAYNALGWTTALIIAAIGVGLIALACKGIKAVVNTFIFNAWYLAWLELPSTPARLNR